MVRWCIRITRLTLVCEVIRYRLAQVRAKISKSLLGLAARNRLSLSLPPSYSTSSYFLSFSIQKKKKIKLTVIVVTREGVPLQARQCSTAQHGLIRTLPGSQTDDKWIIVTARFTTRPSDKNSVSIFIGRLSRATGSHENFLRVCFWLWLVWCSFFFIIKRQNCPWCSLIEINSSADTALHTAGLCAFACPPLVWTQNYDEQTPLVCAHALLMFLLVLAQFLGYVVILTSLTFLICHTLCLRHRSMP